MKEFRNAGWKYLEKMEAIFPEGGASGDQAFYPSGAGMPAGDLDVTDKEIVNELDGGEFFFPFFWIKNNVYGTDFRFQQQPQYRPCSRPECH